MGNVIRINDGFKTYEIRNQDDKLLGSFSFNPSDTNIVHRHTKVKNALSEMKDEIAKQENEESKDTIFDRLETKIYNEIDYLFQSKVSENFFSIMGPFSLLEDGKFFIETVLDVIGQVINDENKNRVDGKIQKHTAKYHG